VVLLVLALAWVAVLFFWFRSRSQSTLTDSVGLFHRHLHVLSRAVPATLAPANRLRGPADPLTIRPLMSVRSAGSWRADPGQPGGSMSREPNGPGRRGTRSARGRGRSAGRRRHSPGAQVRAAARRRRAQRRRRQVLLLLVVLVLATVAVYFLVTRSHTVRTAQIACDAALLVYVLMLVRRRSKVERRTVDLRKLERSEAPARRPQAVMAAGTDGLPRFDDISGGGGRRPDDGRHGSVRYDDAALDRAVGH
jgi:Na+(H+)/acetate symporter ActP